MKEEEDQTNQKRTMDDQEDQREGEGERGRETFIQAQGLRGHSYDGLPTWLKDPMGSSSGPLTCTTGSFCPVPWLIRQPYSVWALSLQRYEYGM